MSATFARIRCGSVPPILADVAVGLAETGVALTLGHVGPPRQWQELGLRGTLLTCAINLSVVLRRRFPVGVLLFCVGLWVCYVQLGYWPVVNSIAPMLLVYTVAEQRPPRWAAAAAALLGGVWVYAAGLPAHQPIWPAVAQALVFPGGAPA